MNSSKQMVRDRTRALNLLKSMTPVDSGHLKHHATFARSRADGFDLVVSKAMAPYAKIVQEGRGYNRNNRNYIGYASTLIARMLARSHNGQSDDSKMYDKLDDSIREERSVLKDRRVKKMDSINRRRGYAGKK